MKLHQLAQTRKAEALQLLHKKKGGFIIPNPWDAGSARLLEVAGFEALASTSAGSAFARGRPDQSLSRDHVLEHLAEIVAASNLPVSADLENGFADSLEEIGKTFRLAADAGVVGGSIEDTTGKSDDPVYALEVAKDRVRAAVEAVRSLPFHFTLTARADNYFVGKPDLADTIRRLQAFQEAGADVLFAPGLSSKEDIATVLREIDRPLNVLMGFAPLKVSELLDMGVQRISVGGSLARAAYGEFFRAALELRDRGTTGYLQNAISSQDINRMLRDFK